MEIIRFEKMHYKKTHVKKNYLINKDYIYEKKTFNLSKKGLKKKKFIINIIIFFFNTFVK